MNTLRRIAVRIARQCADSGVCIFNAVCCPPPQNSNNLHPPLRRVRNGIPAGLAVCILTLAGILAAPEAQAQTPTEKCTGAGWSVSDVFCSIKVHEVVGNGNHSNRAACQITNLGLGTVNDLCTNIFGADLAFPQKPTDGSEPEYVYNCDPNGSKGLIPATINTIAATECTCPDGEGLNKNGVCVSAAQKCRDAKYTPAANLCILINDNVQLGSDAANARNVCAFAPPYGPYHNCADVFSPNYDFPTRTAATNTNTAVFVYNCDPDGTKGLFPATYNLNGEAACCPSGQLATFDTDDVCIAKSIFDKEKKCKSAGWDSSLSDGGSCGIPLTLSGGAVSNKCNLSGSDSPQCDAVFGADVDFPAPTLSADGATLRFVYNCDPNGNTGLIPATSNTIAATECTCPAGQKIVDGICVVSAYVDKCENAGWSFSAADGSCGILLTLSGGDPSDKCYFAGESSPQCADVFGSTLHYFPSPTLSSENATLRFVYNCDPDDENGLFPATANTIAATECMCAAGEEAVGGVCVSSEIAEGARNCLEAEREFSAESGGSCAVAITLSGGTLYSRCHFSGASEPKCDAVFGAEVMFPSLAVAGPFIYNCDPDDENGLIPAQSNTLEATECACPAGGQSVTDGMCACPSGEGVLSDSGICGVCPVGQDVIGGFCLPGVIMGQCVTVGWSFSAADGGSCGVLVTLAGGESADRCYVSGELDPQCDEVFGGTVNYFPAPTLAADGATLRFVYDCDPEGDRGGMVPAAANTIMATECGCASETSHLRPGACVPDEDASPDFDGIAQKALCGAFGGTTVRIATGSGEVCSGMDKNDTFCIMDAADADGVRAFPCRGLFKHLRSCNLEFDRPALNPFFCGAKCGEEMEAVGKDCVPL